MGEGPLSQEKQPLRIIAQTTAPRRAIRQIRLYLLPIAVAVTGISIYLPVIRDLIQELLADQNNSHGLLVLPLAGFLIWKKRQRLAKLKQSPSTAALLLVVLGAVLLPLGAASEIDGLNFLSLLLVIGGIVWHLRGTAVMREILFPYLFAFLAIPWPGLLVETLTFPMQLIAAKGATLSIGLLGIPVVRDGVEIHLQDYVFAVAAPCSGMRSLAALTALGALCAYIFQGSLLKRLVLFAIVPPLALLGNTVRIVVILLLALRWGRQIADGFYHGFSGMVVFLITFVFLLVGAKLLGLKQMREDV